MRIKRKDGMVLLPSTRCVLFPATYDDKAKGRISLSSCGVAKCPKSRSLLTCDVCILNFD